MTERSEQRAQRERIREYRRVVANAVGAVRSQEIRDSFAALSIEELMDQHIARMEETDDPTRPSRLQRVRRIRDDLSNSIEAIRETPPAAFQHADPDRDTNTAPEPEE